MRRMVQSFEREMCCLESELRSVQEQLADHYEYAGNLGNCLNATDVRCESIETSMDAQAANLATFEEEQMEAHGVIETIDCVRCGLMELGGFVRYTSLDRQQRGHMFTQKHANLVIWNLRNRAETTDPQTSDPMHDGEKTEEKLPTHDAVVEPDSYASPGRAEALLEEIRMWH